MGLKWWVLWFSIFDRKSSWHWDWTENVRKKYLFEFLKNLRNLYLHIFRIEISLRFGVLDNQILLHFAFTINQISLNFEVPDNHISLHLGVSNNFSSGPRPGWEDRLIKWAVVRDPQMRLNLVLGDLKRESNLIFLNPKMRWNLIVPMPTGQNIKICDTLPLNFFLYHY